MSDPLEEILASFFIECEELLEALMDALETLSEGSQDRETINVAFRAVHSIKGGAGAFGLDALVAFSHQFETVMDACRADDLSIEGDLTELFFRCCDHLSDLVQAARAKEETDTQLTNALVGELTASLPAETALDATPVETPDFQPMAIELDDLVAGSAAPLNRKLKIKFTPEPELYTTGNEPLILLRNLGEFGEAETTVEFEDTKALNDTKPTGGCLTWTTVLETNVESEDVEEIFEFVDGLCAYSVEPFVSLEDASPSLPEIAALPDIELVPEPDTLETAKPTQIAATVRVDLARIERLVNLVGELVINQAMLSQSIYQDHVSPNSRVASGLEEFLQLTRDIQESVMMIRAQPVKSLFQRMSRIVREASAAVGKSAELITEGENSEIDKTAIERLADPLTHMIRNAIDHGLENSEERIAAGKPEKGSIKLRAAHKSGRVMIELSDDGGGINREKVQSIAVSKGLIPEDAQLSQNEIDQLLFLPGFSTASKISSLSGRGVGMDVVKTEITQLGGRISIDSERGKGTTFLISLPLTLAVLDGMVVRVSGETLVIPINTIVESISLRPSMLRHVGSGQCILPVRESFVPVFDLGFELGYKDHADAKEGAIALLIEPEGGGQAAFIVDSIVDQRQVVIKGLQEGYGRVPGVAAATILGDGRIALILDPSDLVQNVSYQNSNQKRAS